MKTLLKLFLLTAVIGLLFSCTREDEFFTEKSDPLQYGYEKCKPKDHGLDQDRFVTLRVINNNGKRIDLKVHYRVIGKGPVDIIWIPGWTNPLTKYTKQFDFFRDKAKSLYIDLPGQGLSDTPEGIDFTQGLMADAIYCIIRKEGVKKYIGVGHSWGSSPLKQFEIRHPGTITQLALLDVGIPTWPPMNQANREAIYSAQMVWTVANKTPVVTPATDAEYYEIDKYFMDFPNWLLANTYYNWLAEEACQPYPWDIPVLGIWRTMNPANETIMNQHFTGVEINVIGGTYHVIQWFQAETVNQLIDDFMADRSG